MSQITRSAEMNLQASAHSPEPASRWAPWWAYVVAIAPANLGKELVLPDDTAWWLRPGLTAVIAIVAIAFVTAVYRASREDRIP
jgi:hypothetical protein